MRSAIECSAVGGTSERQSGISLEDNVVMGVYDLRGGRVLRVRQFVDEAKALAAVGLSE